MSSTAISTPLSSPDQWNKDYILFLLDSIELPPPSDRQEVLPDAFMNVILSFNQHFQGTSGEVSCIRDSKTASGLSVPT